MPLWSDPLFSLIIFIYVAVVFLYMFYAFCWKEPEEEEDPDKKVISYTKFEFSRDYLTSFLNRLFGLKS
jgi:hypothetical protein